MNEVKDLVPWLSLAVAILAVFWPSIRDRGKNYDSKLEAKADRETVAVLAAKLDVIEDRATRIETNIEHLPDHSTISKLEGLIGKLSGEVGILSERIRPVAAIADRLQEKIMESAGFDR
ncbi:hypothetical protein X566_01345 [Afipia sp. P52-10]|uniref:DUF2730 family protein n=1 Tax=Afipia sp. P52-10 TaxID=1429916 RepID=UPI0003DF1F7E|nr:DUF2730 family protein [Afipia sp. P52-10]ETR79311.1 hypothetical protein X566_01345 [Afipia sp. P52-10]